MHREMDEVERNERSDGPVIHTPASYVERMDLRDIFPHEQPLEVELGAGDGSFLIDWARQNPQRNFMGVERLMGRLKKIERKARRHGLANVRGVRLEISYLIEYLLPVGTVSAFHIYFPDPWPKLRHRKNRLIQEPFSNVLRTALAPGGVVYLRTDHVDYFEQMMAVFRANSRFEAVDTPAALASVLTDFERHFNSNGIATNHAAFRKLA
jgi:tRNA (guanine-N7-)-methyltransferase